jgi:hypothetical protein
MREQPGIRTGRAKTGASGMRGGADEELLLLSGEDERAPWLDPDGEDEGSALDLRRIFVAALIGCGIVTAAIAGTFWVLEERANPDIVADGSVIEAPDEPYKTRPQDPGGMEVAGTGDVSFEVAEGRAHEGVFAPDAFSPPDAEPATEPGAAAPEAVGAVGAADAPLVGVQVGAFASPEEARAGWDRLRARNEALQGRNIRIVEGRADASPVFGLQVVAGSVAEAVALCRAIRDSGGDCQVKR